MDSQIPPDKRGSSQISGLSNEPTQKKQSRLQGLFKGWKVSPKAPIKRLKSQTEARIPATLISNRKTTPVMERVSPPSTPESLRQLAVDAQLAAYPYHRSLEKIASAANIHKPLKDDHLANWSPDKALAQELATQTGLSMGDEPGFLFDRKTGLTAYILANPSLNEVRLVFGGTTSGLSAGNLTTRSRKNRAFSQKQWGTNLKNALGLGVPDSYKQSAELASKLHKKLEADNRTLKLQGHSKGGAEACFAALSNKPPLEAICFSSAELHPRVLKQIPAENRQQALEKITHYNVKRDWVPNMGKLLRQLTHVGKVVTIGAEHAYNSPLDRHDKFTRHIEHFARSQS